MGIADRDYHRQDRREAPGFFSQITPVVKWLLILNLGIYFLDALMETPGRPRLFRELGAFSVQSGILQGRFWELLTFQFLHGNFGHVFFNCVGLFFFGPWMERWWGSKKFLVFYLLCGVAGAVFYTLLMTLHLLPEVWIPASQFNPAELAGQVVRGGMVLVPQSLIGASAGIYGILIGVAVIAPEMRVQLLLPPVELTMRQLALALLAIAVGTIVLGYFHIGLFGLVDNEGGQAGHLGGAILGYFLVRYPWLLGLRRAKVKVYRPQAASHDPPAKLRPRSELQKDQANAVDAILDKISREGFQSLTQAERDFLQKASQHDS